MSTSTAAGPRVAPPRVDAVGPARGATSGPPAGLLLAAALVVLLVSMVLAVSLGPSDIGPVDVWRSVADRIGLGTGRPGALKDAIVWQLRLPRVLTAAAVGAGLAMAGAVMQSLTRNPLADPYLLGLSSGAALGAVTVLVLGVGLLLPVAAFAGALLALAATLGLAGSLGALTPTRTVLAGLAVAQLAAAATSFVIFWSSTGDSYREILSWLMGTLGGTTWTSVLVSGGAVLVVGTALVATARVLDAFAFGDTAASALGINVAAVRWTMLSGVALLTAALVAVSGSIGFIGLVLPNATRLLVGARHRLLVPLSALLGAAFLVWADAAARTLFEPRELPVGIITALLGAPVFGYLLWRRRAAA